MKAPVIINNATGNPAVFSDGADGLPIQSLKVHLLPRQEGTGNPSPSNIRSIIPWNGLTVLSFAENLLNINSTGKTQSGMSYTTVEKGGKRVAVRVSGETTDNNSFFNLNYVSAETLSILPGNYKAYGYTEKVGFRVYYIDANGAQINALITDVPEPVNTFTIPTDAKCSWMRLQAAPNVQIDELIYPILIPADEPITETDISFPSPVYGGTLDVVSGVLTVEYIGGVFKWSQGTNETVYENVKRRRFDPSGSGGIPTGSANSICNIAKYNANINLDEPHFYKVSGTSGYYVYLPINTDENTEIILCGKLATPREIQLTPQQINAIKGDNTIWSDANGDIEVEYRADTGLFLKQNTVKDVQVNGSSILTDGVANIPPISSGGLGLARSSNNGIQCNSQGQIFTKRASSAEIKEGTHNFNVIVPSNQHESAFYALAKLAGVDMAQSSNPVGTYTDAAKQGIQKMLGFEDILGNYESSTTASKAYTVGETFIFNGKRYRVTADIAQNYVIIPGTNCVLDPIDGRYVKKTDYATANTAGLVKPGSGIALEANTGKIYMDNASEAQIKGGAATNIAIPPFRQHISAFFGLSKAAGVDLANETVTVGTYPQTAKTAIQTMLGIEADIPLIEEVSGSTPSITGMPNVRYICGTCSLLTITPPASGSIVVRFTSGSTPTVLTVPNTVKFPVWFDYTSLEADTTYEIIITDGVYGGVMSWAD